MLQIAKRLDTHASSADRFLITLQNLGYVDKREQIGKYRLTDRLLKIASNLIVSHPLTVRYLDVMHTLAYNLNATTHIMAFYGLSTITLHKDLQTQNISYNNAFFDPKRQHYCSVPGKLLLSTLPEEQLSEYLSGLNPVLHGAQTVSFSLNPEIIVNVLDNRLRADKICPLRKNMSAAGKTLRRTVNFYVLQRSSRYTGR